MADVLHRTGRVKGRVSAVQGTLIVLAAVLALLTAQGQWSTGGDNAAPRLSAPPAAQPSATQFGFTYGFQYSAAGLARFKHDVEELVAHRQKWIRIGIASWEVQSGGSGTRINWKADAFRYLDQEIDFVHRSGLKLYLITAEMPSWAESSPLNNYNRSAAAYCAQIAERYKGKIAVWQVFNATNQQNYKTHVPVTLSSAYLRQENEVLAHLRGAIKSVDPSIVITTNSDGFPLSAAMRENYVAFFDGIQSQLDMIALDLYPGTDHTVIKRLGRWIDLFRDRYGKPVAVAETGLQTCAGCWGGNPFAQQKATLVAALAELKQAHASLVLVYAYRDWGTDPLDGEQNFGIVRFDGTHKPSYDAVMAAMR